jgi:hypothetical protein
MKQGFGFNGHWLGEKPDAGPKKPGAKAVMEEPCFVRVLIGETPMHPSWLDAGA